MEPPNHLATNKSQSSPLRVAPFPLVLLLRMAPFLLLPLIILDARGYSSFYATDIEFQRGRIGYDEYVQVFNRGAVSFDNDRRVAEYLKSHTSPDDPILVWGLAPSIYYLSGRPSSTRYVFHHVLLTSSPFSVRYPGLEERQEAFMAELDRRPPKIIVIGTNDRNGFEPEDSYTQMLAFPRFKDYVFENYRPETKIGRFLIARRID